MHWVNTSGLLQQMSLRSADGLYVCPRVSRSVVTLVSPAKMVEPIEMPFGMLICVGPRNHVLDEDTHGCHLANTTE